MSSPLVDSIAGLVAAAMPATGRALLAVSGGLDSMVLLDAAAMVRDPARLLVATFDHGTGAAARAACALVQRVAAARGIECIVGRARGPIRRSEATWREARWAFLRDVARVHGAAVVTAHTGDDQIETVLMRAMRDSGPRGMAALLAPGDVLRPLLGVRRASLVEFANVRDVEFMEDPTNVSRTFLRNRIRHDILPALRRANPRIDDELLQLGRRSAEWRRETDAAANSVSKVDLVARTADVSVTAIRGLDAEQLAVLWPAIAARIGVTLDRRGIQRAGSFSSSSRVGARIQVSGGWEVVRSRHGLRLQLAAHAPKGGEALLDPSSATRWGRWTFWVGAGGRAASVSSTTGGQSGWNARLPVDQPLRVREWRPGDRLIGVSGGTGRKVKRLLNDAGVTGHERDGWPVVLSGDRIVWIPGVRRGDAATARPAGGRSGGRPLLTFSCARNDG